MMLPLGGTTYVVTRQGAVTYVDGLPVYPTPSAFSVFASVQPLNGRDLQRAPDGLRSSDALKAYIYTVLDAPLRTVLADGHAADMVSVDGVLYQVYHTEGYNAFAPLPHQKAYLQAPQGTDGAQVGP